jgi:hypothetical protein
MARDHHLSLVSLLQSPAKCHLKILARKLLLSLVRSPDSICKANTKPCSKLARNLLQSLVCIHLLRPAKNGSHKPSTKLRQKPSSIPSQKLFENQVGKHPPNPARNIILRLARIHLLSIVMSHHLSPVRRILLNPVRNNLHNLATRKESMLQTKLETFF